MFTKGSMKAAKHTINELKIMQAYPLEMKIEKSKRRIAEWVNYWGLEKVAVSFSGGKDSTVLLHIARQFYPTIKAVFSNTGLEFPEIVAFVKTFDNVEIIRPKLNFRQVIERYGYPIISKEVSERIESVQTWRKTGGGHSKWIYEITGEIAHTSNASFWDRGFL